MFTIGRDRRGQYVHPPPAIMSVCLSVGSSDFVSVITFDH